MPSSDQSTEVDALADNLDLFYEPEGFYAAEKAPTSATHWLRSGERVTVRLVGHNPLWGHLLWNAGRTVADYLEEHADETVQGKDVLELGAGAGLPSLVCSIKGARKVVVTDYPDADLIENLKQNISSSTFQENTPNIHAVGYLWGNPTEVITSYLDDPSAGFDLLILADLLFNHSEHLKLLSTVTQTLKKSPEARALVFFTPYRPWLLEKDLFFFELAESSNFTVTKILEKYMDKVMFEEDPGVIS
ncbi:MAG: nicotinamide n-methyltransferase [Piccolia ochrophora]|nr:MAG: nicotinamide n-methyltransferase [Piccolia ochrophora]